MLGRIRHYKVTCLPKVLEADAFYWVLLANGKVEGYLTDVNGVAKRIEGDAATINAVAAIDLIKGSPVAIDRATGKFVAANAGFKPTAFVVGLLNADVALGFVGNAVADRLKLDDWTPIAGTPTLSPGVTYFLNSAGGLSVVPDGSCIAIVGKALDTETLLIDIENPIEL
jgi:hypothetical protein